MKEIKTNNFEAFVNFQENGKAYNWKEFVNFQEDWDICNSE